MADTINNFFDQLKRVFSPRAEVELINHRKIDHSLRSAVEEGDLEKALQLIFSLEDLRLINSIDLNHSFRSAAEEGNREKALQLIKQLYLDHSFRSAVEEGDLEKAEQLLKEGADINVETLPGDRSILICVEDLKIVKWLIEKGIDVNAQSDGMTALHFAGNSNSCEKAALLIKNGADVNVRGANNNTPLHEAVLMGNVEVFELLLNYGADATLKNSFNQTVLHFALGNCVFALKKSDVTPNNNKIVARLIKEGVDINAQDVHGNTVLHYASFPGREEIRDFLLEQGANPDIQNNNQQTAEDLYCKNANNPIYIHNIAQGIDLFLTPDMPGEDSSHQSENEVLPSGEYEYPIDNLSISNPFC